MLSWNLPQSFLPGALLFGA